MTLPTILVTEVQQNGSRISNFQLQTGKPEEAVHDDFLEIAGKHSVVESGGGCYQVEAKYVDSEDTTSYLGGMYVPLNKHSAVWADFSAKGYMLKQAK